jgi:hypothetical protein
MGHILTDVDTNDKISTTVDMKEETVVEEVETTEEAAATCCSGIGCC